MRKIQSLKTLKKVILLDLRARRVGFQFRLVLNPIIRFQIALRIFEYLIDTQRSLSIFIFKLYFRSLSLKLGFSIPPKVFGPGLCMVHYGTIVVSPRAVVGRNCRLHVGVNIGGKAGFYDYDIAARLCPTIGSNCYIGPGAKIFGPVLLGNHCKIGANAVVTRSFPETGHTLIGIPAKPLRKSL